MVHSKGTRCESHRFRIDLTGSTKYCGRSIDFRRDSAGGDFAARRAIPTSEALTALAGSATAARVTVSDWPWGARRSRVWRGAIRHVRTRVAAAWIANDRGKVCDPVLWALRVRVIREE